MFKIQQLIDQEIAQIEKLAKEAGAKSPKYAFIQAGVPKELELIQVLELILNLGSNILKKADVVLEELKATVLNIKDTIAVSEAEITSRTLFYLGDFDWKNLQQEVDINKLNIVYIGGNADFFNCEKLLTSGLIKVGKSAEFGSCYNLESCNLEETGWHADFRVCINLKNCNLIKTGGGAYFNGCSKLITSYLKETGDNASFHGCSGLVTSCLEKAGGWVDYSFCSNLVNCNLLEAKGDVKFIRCFQLETSKLVKAGKSVYFSDCTSLATSFLEKVGGSVYFDGCVCLVACHLMNVKGSVNFYSCEKLMLDGFVAQKISIGYNLYINSKADNYRNSITGFSKNTDDEIKEKFLVKKKIYR